MSIRSRTMKLVSLVAISAVLMALVACASEEPAAPAGPSAEEIAKLVSDSVNASVSQAVADAVPEGTSAMEIQKMVEAAVKPRRSPGSRGLMWKRRSSPLQPDSSPLRRCRG